MDGLLTWQGFGTITVGCLCCRLLAWFGILAISAKDDIGANTLRGKSGVVLSLVMYCMARLSDGVCLVAYDLSV